MKVEESRIMSQNLGQAASSIQPVKQIEAKATKVKHGEVLAENVTQSSADIKPPPSVIARTVIIGLVIVGLTFVGAGVWAATAPLASAVTAHGTLVVVGRQRTVQHLEGGIVAALHVKEGMRVEAGDVLLSLDPTSAQSMVERLQSQVDTQLAIRDRLHAELFGREKIIFDPNLINRKDLSGPATAMQVQEQEFSERQKTLQGTVDVLQQRIEQLGSSIDGMEAQKVSKKSQVELIGEESISLEKLLDKGLARRSSLLALQREAASLAGDVGEIDAEIARSREQIGEARLQIIQAKQEMREKIVSQLADTESRLVDLLQQLVVADDVLKRVDILAPISGIIQELNINTVGGVVTPREPLMEIAPDAGELLVEAQVSPLDIDKISLGQEAEVRFSALDLRTTPSIFGTVTTTSGDRIVDQYGRNAPYYRVQVATTAKELKKLGDQKLQAGMPAEVLIKTKDRTLLNYFMKPLTDAMSRGMREE
ncbi:HlyD family type I secretion periplasmic adaptor subunit [Roseibium limicola]|uniref:Membrane fusion protein (MFP) family protein n=1 Tax=Roseibium limicola TaxID=2816037 RepID=A0A939J839_9HYPH|nr:HlyD family type I secretion periplasmic adaptor subunit [Roseibium limicola]MBO0346807.1 HlyD family type I secretion periplasmic adaptor subunit [Roseibium limicola]